jgi:HECT-like Ubiquitin-conjugating enzyme (E2)-binding
MAGLAEQMQQMQQMQRLLEEARVAREKAQADVLAAQERVRSTEKIANKAVAKREKAASKVEATKPAMDSDEFREKLMEAAMAADKSREETRTLEELKAAERGDTISSGSDAASAHPDSLASRTAAVFKGAVGATSGFYALLDIPASGPYLCDTTIQVRFTLGKRAPVTVGPRLPFAITEGSAGSTDACCLSSEFPCKNDFLGVYRSDEDNSITGNFDLSFSDVATEEFQAAMKGHPDGYTGVLLTRTATLSLPGSLTGSFNIRFVTHSGVVAGVSETFEVVRELPVSGAATLAVSATKSSASAAQPERNLEELELDALSGIDNGIIYSRPDGSTSSAAVSVSAGQPTSAERAGDLPVRKPLNKPLPAPTFSYSLEFLSQIGVYSILIPLPEAFRVGTASAGAAPSVRGTQPVLELPKDWRPGMVVKDCLDDDDKVEDDGNASSTTPPGKEENSSSTRTFQTRPVSTIELSFELPCELPANTMPSPIVPAAAVAKLPRNLYRLKIGLPQRVDAAEANLEVHPDHIAVRAPLFYRGAMTLRNDKPLSSISQRELYCLKQPLGSSNLSCRLCRNQFMLASSTASGTTAPALSSSDGSTKAPLRAEVLPSEYWLDMSDFWLCHGDEKNILIPSSDFGAIEGTILIAESSLQLHPRDVNGDAFLVAAPSSSSTEHRGLEELVTCSLLCKRCRSKIGQMKVSPDVIRSLASPQQLPLCALFGDALGKLAPRLAKDSDPYPQLFKDSLWVPEVVTNSTATARKTKGAAKEQSKETAGKGSAKVHADGHGKPSVFDNVLRVYTPATRISERILSSILAHGQYSFLVQSKSAVAVVGAAASNMPSKTTAVALLVTAWNGKVAQASSAVPGSASGGSDKTTQVLSPQPVPALRVQYRLLESTKDAFISLPMEAAPSNDFAVDAPDIWLEPWELERLAETLLESTDALPPSRRQVGGGSAALVGFLPLALVR